MNTAGVVCTPKTEMTRLLISGGPGAGCTSTANTVGAALDEPVFDSDDFFHKPSDPPYQEPWPPDERRRRLTEALAATPDNWIVSGSIATWQVDLPATPLGVFLDVPCDERLRRLHQREHTRFGNRLDPGGDMHDEHQAFIPWAADYERRTAPGRSRATDHSYLEQTCAKVLTIRGNLTPEEVTTTVLAFLANPDGAASIDPSRT